jgi:hypothetical protein
VINTQPPHRNSSPTALAHQGGSSGGQAVTTGQGESFLSGQWELIPVKCPGNVLGCTDKLLQQGRLVLPRQAQAHIIDHYRNMQGAMQAMHFIEDHRGHGH